jgi:hypothetical protein
LKQEGEPRGEAGERTMVHGDGSDEGVWPSTDA